MNIYVGNLPFTITEDQLKELFVEMPTQSAAEAAIKGLNGTSVRGMTIQVNIARDRRRR
jgi:RNA recognition motif-containing protein